MKKVAYLYSLVFLLCSFKGNEKSVGSRDCASVKNGRFRIEDREAGTTIIERMGNTQIETIERMRLKLLFDVVWTDACTYTLQLRKVLQDDLEQPLPPDSTVVTARIMEFTDSSYIIAATSNISTTSMKFELIRMKD